MFGVPNALLNNRLKLHGNNVICSGKEVNISIEDRPMQESYAYSKGEQCASNESIVYKEMVLGRHVPQAYQTRTNQMRYE